MEGEEEDLEARVLNSDLLRRVFSLLLFLNIVISRAGKGRKIGEERKRSKGARERGERRQLRLNDVVPATETALSAGCLHNLDRFQGKLDRL